MCEAFTRKRQNLATFHIISSPVFECGKHITINHPSNPRPQPSPPSPKSSRHGKISQPQFVMVYCVGFPTLDLSFHVKYQGKHFRNLALMPGLRWTMAECCLKMMNRPLNVTIGAAINPDLGVIFGFVLRSGTLHSIGESSIFF